MEPSHKIALLKSRITLLHDLQLDVLDYLVEKDILNFVDTSNVTAKATRYEKAQYLLDLLPRRGAGAFSAFLASLDSTCQGHLTTEIKDALDSVTTEDKLRAYGEQTGSGIDMSKHVALAHTQSNLEIELNAWWMLNKLLSRLVIRQEEFDEISKSPTRQEQVKALLSVLKRKDDRSFDEFLQELDASQAWLGQSLKKLKVTSDDTAYAEYQLNRFKLVLPTTAALQRDIRLSLRQKLEQDENASLAEILLRQTGSDMYIPQPIIAQRCSKGVVSEQISVKSVDSLLEVCSRGERILVYGEAGMGKTALIKYIMQLWVENKQLCNLFDYVLPVHLRSVETESITDVVVKLLPPQARKLLKKDMTFKSRRILFLLDSFEELTCESKELEMLLRGDLFASSVVLVTSRRSSSLSAREKELCQSVVVYLQGIPEEHVRKNIEKYSQGEDTLLAITESFFGMPFLSHPMIMVLACFLASEMSSDNACRLPNKQTALYNRVVQHLILPYIRKKKGTQFEPCDQNPLENTKVPMVARSFLWTAGEMSLSSFDHGKRLCRFPKAEYKDFGLFIDGPDENTVVVPHLSFQECWAAMYLSVSRADWQEVLRGAMENAILSPPKLSLQEALEPRENMIKFLVGFSSEAAIELSQAFVIKQQPTWCGFQSQLQYELDLIHECSDDVKQELADALLNAPVITLRDSVSDYLLNRGSHFLLKLFDNDVKRHAFLRKAYGMHLSDGVLSRCDPSNGIRFCWDNYVVAFVYYYNCFVEADDVSIVHSQIPVEILTRNMIDVQALSLWHCTMCDIVPPLITDLNLKATPVSRPCMENTSIRDLKIKDIDCFKHLENIRMTGVRLLWLDSCGDINLGRMANTFNAVSRLGMFYNKLVYSLVGVWESVRELRLHKCSDIRINSLPKVLPNLENLKLESSVVNVEGPTAHWSILKKFRIWKAHLQKQTSREVVLLSEKEAVQIIGEMAKQATIDVYGYEQSLHAAEKREEVRRQHLEGSSLQKLVRKWRKMSHVDA